MLHIDTITRVPEHIALLPVDALPYIRLYAQPDVIMYGCPTDRRSIPVQTLLDESQAFREFLGDDIAIPPEGLVPTHTNLDDTQLKNVIRRLYVNPIEPRRYVDMTRIWKTLGKDTSILEPDLSDGPLPEVPCVADMLDTYECEK